MSRDEALALRAYAKEMGLDWLILKDANPGEPAAFQLVAQNSRIMKEREVIGETVEEARLTIGLTAAEARKKTSKRRKKR
jgi:hypothetical protein